jgi:outer membrane biosynthesis protein TonB
MLRLKREAPDDDFPDRLASADTVEPEDRDFPSSGERGLSAVSGPVIAAAAFAPTFLAIFFGLQYAVGPPTPDRGSDELATLGSTPVPVGPATRLSDQPAPPPDGHEVGRPTAPSESPMEASAPVESPSLPPAHPSLPDRSREAAAPHERPHPEQQPRAQQPAQEPTAWTRAAGFTEREAAARLAGSIWSEGYPVEIRREGSAARPWVVWVGTRPRDSGRHR